MCVHWQTEKPGSGSPFILYEQTDGPALTTVASSIHSSVRKKLAAAEPLGDIASCGRVLPMAETSLVLQLATITR